MITTTTYMEPRLQDNELTHQNMMRWIKIAITGALFLISFIVRWSDVQYTPYGFDQDEYSFITIAKLKSNNIPIENKVIVPLPIDGSQSYPFYTWVNTLTFRVFGPDLMAARKFLTIYSIITLCVFYALARKFLSWRISILITAVYSFSAFHMIINKIAMPNAYQELPALLAFYTALQAGHLPKIQKYTAALLSGLFVVCAMLTFNVGYMTPCIALCFLVYGLSKNPSTKKTHIVTVLCFLLPLIIISPFFIQTIMGQWQSKQYVFVDAKIGIPEKSLGNILSTIFNNAKNIALVLTKPLNGPTSDMLAKFSEPLIPPLITLTACFGIVAAFYSLKKYWPLICWIGIQIGIYHLLMGLNLARVWILTTDGIYICSGIFLDTVLKNRTKKIEKIASNMLLVIFMTYLIIIGIHTYNTSAIYNEAYQPCVRDAYTITKKFALPEQNTFIIPETGPCLGNRTWLTAMYFYLSDDAKKMQLYANATESDFQILSPIDFKMRLFDNQLPTCSTIIGEPNTVIDIFGVLSIQCEKQYRIEKTKTYWIAYPTVMNTNE